MFYLPNMMGSYKTCEDQNPQVPYLIDEFFDFKIFVEPHLLDGNSKIVGIKKCHLFKFHLIDGRPIIQYKTSIDDETQSPPIDIWHSHYDGSVELPMA